MSAPTLESGQAFNLTATGNVGRAGQDCTLIGFYVNSTSSGTIVFRVGGSGGTALGTITPAVGFHRYPLNAPKGLHVTIGDTLDVTLFVVPGQA